MTKDPYEIYKGLPLSKQREIDAMVAMDVNNVPWRPLINVEQPDIPTPQQQAFDCPADIMLYGGAAGGGKSALVIGLALTAHQRSLILRREVNQVESIADEIIKIRKSRDGYNGQSKKFDLGDNKVIKLGGMQHVHDKEKYKGTPYDLYAFDELADFLEEQFRYVIAWNRSTDPEQRCRVVCTSNPPQTAEGQWMINFWGPWLDPHHPNPALPGELRWYTTKANKDYEAEGPDPVMIDGEMVIPRSRTFIPSSVEDNPFLMETGYKSQLQALPEPLRSQMLKGDFTAGGDDNAWQVIPTAWVEAAQRRWTDARPNGMKMSGLGVDPARGGKDRTVIAKRYGSWYDKLFAVDGSQTPDGPRVSALCMEHVSDGAPIFIDVIGGAGTSPYDHLRTNGANVVAVDGRGSSDAREKSGKFGFHNKRSEMWWRFREALDPESGDNICLPPDRELLSDLCAPRYSIGSGNNAIKVESKGTEKPDEKGRATGLIKRLGRSPDKGDAVVYAWCEGGVRKIKGGRPKRTNSRYNPFRHRRRG